MEEKLGGNCLVCGEDLGSMNCDDGGSLSSFESYFNSYQSSYQGEVNLEGKQLRTCEGCSEKVILVKNGKEEVEGLQKDVSVLEGNLQQKLLELESAGERHLNGLKELELLIKNGSQQKDSKERDDYLREGMGKGSFSVAKSLKIVEEKMFLAKIMTSGVFGSEVEKPHGLVGTGLGLDPSVILLAAKNDAKMQEIDVFGMKNESKDAGIITAKALTAEPDQFEVVKVKPEKELIGTARRRVDSREGNKTFELFPEEVWEITLDQMESKDILTVLRVLPHLDNSISNHKRFWYIDQILPFLGNKITEKDVLNLRLVCKQWQSRVDNFLPNQPYCRAYSEDLHKDNLNFWSFLENEEHCNRFKGNSPTISLKSIAESPLSNVAQMMEHPPTRNPFVFRYLFLDIAEIYENANGQAKKLFEFLKQCGQHLWFLCVSLVLPVQHTEIKTLIRILKLTGNLKSLSIQMDENGDGERHMHSCVFGFEKDLPDLPFLETFKVEVQPRFFDENCERGHEISRGIILRYGPQIRRMKMIISHWRTEFKDLFPNLTELESSFWMHPSESDIFKLENLLYCSSLPSLAKLQLRFYNAGDGPMPFTIQQDIFKWLKRFPQIKYFELSSDVIDHFIDELRLEADPVKDCIPSIETLKIVDGHGLSYEILHCFPSLRHLEITCNDRPSVVDLSMPDSCVKIREQLQTARLYQSNIWELFPNLRKVDIVATDVYKFNRENYEKWKKAGKLTSEPRLHNLRKDIQDFLNPNEEMDVRFHDVMMALLHNAENEEDSDDSSSSNGSSEYETISEYSGSDNEGGD